MKRTLAPSDVFSALSELEFDSFRSRLEQELEAYTEIKAGKRRAKKSDVNGAGDASVAAGSSGSAAAGTRDGDEDVEMVDNPAKRVKRDSEGGGVVSGDGDGDETQEEDGDDEGEVEDEEEEEEDEEEEDENGHLVEDDIDRVEDLDSAPRPRDPDADAEESDDDDDDGPGNQLRDNMGLG